MHWNPFVQTRVSILCPEYLPSTPKSLLVWSNTTTETFHIKSNCDWLVTGLSYLCEDSHYHLSCEHKRSINESKMMCEFMAAVCTLWLHLFISSQHITEKNIYLFYKESIISILVLYLGVWQQKSL